MKIITEDGKIKVLCEYNPDFIKKAKLIQGKWDGKYWTFPEDNTTEVKDLLLEVYGENGEPQECVNIIVDLYYLHEDKGSIRFAGRTLATRRSRDSDVVLGDNVMLVSGGFSDSGGSRNNPCVSAEKGTKVKIKSVPIAMYERIKDESYVELCEDKPTSTTDNASFMKELSIRRVLNEDTRKQGVLVGGKVYSMHFTKEEVIITDNEDYTKIYYVASVDFWRALEEN